MNRAEQMDLRLARSLRGAIAAGHPWVYRNALRELPPRPAGTVARLLDRDGFVAWGLYDPDHPIAFRVTGRDETTPPGPAWLGGRLDAAAALRAAVVASDVEAWRVLHGEADGTPGFALDRYGPVCVVRSDGAAAVARLDWLTQAIAARAGAWGVRSLVHRRARGDEDGPRATLLWGEAPPADLVCREYAWRMEADVLQGQKTGWFIDQRENRRRVFEIARGRRVLNLFAYSGGFSLAAALGGAAQVTSVDISAAATAAARRNFALNGLEVADYEFVAADAFDWLPQALTAGRRYDLAIVDPPSFAPNARSLPRALRAYGRLLRDTVALLEPPGLLCAASCSSHVTMAHMHDLLSGAAAARGAALRVLDERGAGPDHPVLPAFDEGRYLKWLLCAIDRGDAPGGELC